LRTARAASCSASDSIVSNRLRSASQRLQIFLALRRALHKGQRSIIYNLVKRPLKMAKKKINIHSA
jgi:hypothetical protein